MGEYYRLVTVKPNEMSLSQTVNTCVEKGWGQGDQSKMMKFFSITRPMADKVAELCEAEYLARFRADRAEAAIKYKDHPMRGAHGKTVWRGR